MATPLEFILSAVDTTKKAFDSFSANTKRAEKDAGGLLQRLRDFTIVGIGVEKAFGAITGAINDAMAAADRQLRAEVGLAAAMARTGQETRRSFEAFREFAAQRASVTTFADEVTLELGRVGATFGLYGEHLKRAVAASQDLSVALGRGPTEILQQLAKFGVGASDSLAELGITVNANADRWSEFDRVLRRVNTGLAEAVGQLPTSGWQQLGNAITSVKERLGEVVTSTGSFQRVIGAIRGFADELAGALADPAKMREVVTSIDNFVTAVINGVKKGSAEVLRFLAKLLEGFELVATKIVALMHLFDREAKVEQLAGRLKEVEEEIERLGDATEPARSQIDKLIGEAALLRAQMEMLVGGVDLGSRAMRDFAASVEEPIEPLSQFQRLASTVLDSIFDKARAAGQAIRDAARVPLPQIDMSKLLSDPSTNLLALREELERIRDMPRNNAPGSLVEDPLSDQMRENLKLLEEELGARGYAVGSAYAGSFTTAIVDSFNSDIGARDAFRQLGVDLKNQFIAQLSDSAFDPIKQAIGRLAIAVAAPFQALGQLVAAPLNIIASLITKVIGQLVTEFLAVIGLQKIAAITGVASMAAVGASASSVAAAWGAAAVAAAIGTLGAALAFGPAAIGMIATGSAITAALAIPALAEGGIAMPKPGGHLVRVAEAGAPEAILPLDPRRLRQMLNDTGVMGGLSLTVNVNGAGDEDPRFVGRQVGRSASREFMRRLAAHRDFRGLPGHF